MSRRVIIGLWILCAVAFLATEASAGCATIGGKRVCASYITGGSEIGIVTAEGFAPNQGACPAVVATQEGVCSPYDCECNNTCGDGPVLTSNIGILQAEPAAAVTLRLVGTIDTLPGDGVRCGLGPTDDQTCDIRGVAYCGAGADSKPKHGDKHADKHTGHSDSQQHRAVTSGPLTVFAPGFAQVDPSAKAGEGRHFAGFRFQINPVEQNNLCNVVEDGAFRTFVALEGFFEACVIPNPLTNPTCLEDVPEADRCTCVREFCTVGPPSSPDEVQPYQCRPV